jgi:hypothetical protein
MYAANPEQAVKMRGLAQRMRHDAEETADWHYRHMFHKAARELEEKAARLERSFSPPHRRLDS